MKSEAKKLDGLGKLQKFEKHNQRIVTIPQKVLSKNKVVNKPWWNEKCQEAIDKRKISYKRVTNSLSKETIREYRKASHEARRTIRKRKKEYFKSFVSEIGNSSINNFWG